MGQEDSQNRQRDVKNMPLLPCLSITTLTLLSLHEIGELVSHLSRKVKVQSSCTGPPES